MKAFGGTESIALGRRWFLRAALVGATGVALGMPMSGCSQSLPRGARHEFQSGSVRSSLASNKILVAYFSRAGENYYYGGRIDLKVGNTEALTGMISKRIRCDVYRIQPADPYPDDYEETVQRNVREQEANARPAIANPLAAIDRYDTILLGSPIWNVRAPMIMSSFVEKSDFTSKTIHPFTTYAMSGLGATMRDYAASCPGATIGEGLPVRGEQVNDAGPAVDSWLRRTGLPQRRSGEVQAPERRRYGSRDHAEG
jgi:flavodoxin